MSEQPLTVLVVDDEAPALADLSRLLRSAPGTGAVRGGERTRGAANAGRAPVRRGLLDVPCPVSTASSWRAS